MARDLDEIIDALVSATRRAFDSVMRENPDDTFYAFVLSMLDDPHGGIMASANSLQNHQTVMERWRDRPGAPHEEHLRWSPCEWGRFEYVDASEFHQVSKLISAELAAVGDSDDAFAELHSGLHQSMQHTLKTLDDEGLWGHGAQREAVTLFCTVYDSARAESLEEESARFLNSQATFARFQDRYAETERLQALEERRREERFGSVGSLAPQDQAEHWLGQLRLAIDEPGSDSLAAFVERRELVGFLQRIGEPAVHPILGYVERRNEQWVGDVECPELLMIVAETASPTLATCDRLVRLLESTCASNEGKERWQRTPLFVARCLSRLIEGYPTPQIGTQFRLVEHRALIAAGWAALVGMSGD